MKDRAASEVLGSARASRAGDGASPSRTSPRISARAPKSAREGACAPQSCLEFTRGHSC